MGWEGQTCFCLRCPGHWLVCSQPRAVSWLYSAEVRIRFGRGLKRRLCIWVTGLIYCFQGAWDSRESAQFSPCVRDALSLLAP